MNTKVLDNPLSSEPQAVGSGASVGGGCHDLDSGQPRGASHHVPG